MIVQSATIQIVGKQFAPEAVAKETGIVFADIDRTPDYTFADIKPPETVDHRESIEWLIGRVTPHIELIRLCGGDEIRLDVALFHDGQCNWLFSREDVDGLAKLNAVLMVSAYKDEQIVEEDERRRSQSE